VRRNRRAAALVRPVCTRQPDQRQLVLPVHADEAFAYGFGTEWFIRDGQGPGITETDIMAGL
jgi:hypothetical protein